MEGSMSPDSSIDSTPSVAPRRGSVPILLALLASAVSLASCGSQAESASSSQGTRAGDSAPGGGLVFELDPANTTEKAPMRSDGTYELRPNFHDFGSVADGDMPSYVFRLRNTDPNPIAIKKVKPSCGCTVPSLRYVTSEGEVVRGLGHTIAGRPHLILPPEHVLEVEVRIDTSAIKTKNADKLNTVTISTDSPNSYYINLETHIIVEAPFNIVPMTLDLGRIPQSAGGGGYVDIVPALGFHKRVTEIVQQPDDLHCELTYENVLGNDKWTVTTRFEPGLDLGRQARTLVVATETEEGEPGPQIHVPVVCMVVEDIQFEPGRFVFRAAKEERFTIRMRTLLQGHRYSVLAAEVPKEHRDKLQVSYAEEDADADGKSPSWLLTLTMREVGDLSQYPLRGQLRLRLDDPQHGEVAVGYVIHAPTQRRAGTPGG